MIDKLETKEPLEVLGEESYLLDTCFLIYEINQGNGTKLLDFCKKNNVYITSFNIEELKASERKIPNIKHKIKSFLDKKQVKKIEIDVHIGEWNNESKFADDINADILKNIHDPSDAVLAAMAIKTKSTILTRDKHHIFTQQIENLLSKFGVSVNNSLKDS